MNAFGIGQTTGHIAWCRRLFDSLADGGEWAIPRNGLIFTRRGDDFVLTAAMDHEPGMPMTRAELYLYQQEEFDQTKQMFGYAGITVLGSPDDARTGLVT